MRKNLLCRWCCVPLRVPTRTLTNKTENWKPISSHLSPFPFHLTSRAVDSTLSSAESYTCIPNGENYILCECLTSFASRWALLTIVPIPTGLHRPRKERGCYTYCPRLSCVSFICSICQSSFRCEQVGNRTPAAWKKGGIAAIQFPVRLPGLHSRR